MQLQNLSSKLFYALYTLHEQGLDGAQWLADNCSQEELQKASEMLSGPEYSQIVKKAISLMP